MRIDLKRLSIGKVAERTDVHIATVWRWVLHGVKGRKLPSIMVGGRRFILESDLETFLDQDTKESDSDRFLGPDNNHAAPQPTPPAAIAAGQELDELMNSLGRHPSREKKGPVLPIQTPAASPPPREAGR